MKTHSITVKYIHVSILKKNVSEKELEIYQLEVLCRSAPCVIKSYELAYWVWACSSGAECLRVTYCV